MLNYLVGFIEQFFKGHFSVNSTQNFSNEKYFSNNLVLSRNLRREITDLVSGL